MLANTSLNALLFADDLATLLLVKIKRRTTRKVTFVRKILS